MCKGKKRKANVREKGKSWKGKCKGKGKSWKGKWKGKEEIFDGKGKSLKCKERHCETANKDARGRKRGWLVSELLR